MTYKAILSGQYLENEEIESRILASKEIYIQSDNIRKATEKAQEQLVDPNGRVISISEMPGTFIH